MMSEQGGTAMSNESAESPQQRPDEPSILGDAALNEAQAALKAAVAEALNAATQAETSAVAAKESQGTIAAVMAEAQTKFTEISKIVSKVVTAETSIADSLAAIAAKSEHIEQARAHTDKVRGELDRLLTESTQKATETEGLRSRAQQAVEESSKSAASIQGIRTAADADRQGVSSALASANDSAEKSRALADKADSVQAALKAYEDRLAHLEKQCSEQLKAIEKLLPGATSAGLASAYNERRQEFHRPTKNWQKVFIISVLAITGLAAYSFWHALSADQPPGYDDVFKLLLSRLPIVIPLVWIALHAAREAALAARLEEDYGYKAAIAASFQGFHKQMSEIAAEQKEGSPVIKLCNDTLANLGAPPGRIYDKHKLTITPTDELKEAFKEILEARLGTAEKPPQPK
jgi:hypothetical protein